MLYASPQNEIKNKVRFLKNHTKLYIYFSHYVHITISIALFLTFDIFLAKAFQLLSSLQYYLLNSKHFSFINISKNFSFKFEVLSQQM